MLNVDNLTGFLKKRDFLNDLSVVFTNKTCFKKGNEILLWVGNINVIKQNALTGVYFNLLNEKYFSPEIDGRYRGM